MTRCERQMDIEAMAKSLASEGHYCERGEAESEREIYIRVGRH